MVSEHAGSWGVIGLGCSTAAEHTQGWSWWEGLVPLAFALALIVDCLSWSWQGRGCSSAPGSRAGSSRLGSTLPVPPPDPRCSHGAWLSPGQAGGRLAGLSALPCWGSVLHCSRGDSPARWGSPRTAQPTPGGHEGSPAGGSAQQRHALACAGEEAGRLLPSFISPQHEGCLLGEVSLQHFTSRGWWRSAATVTQRMAASLMGRLLSTKQQRKLEPSLLRMRICLCPAWT